MSAKSFSYWGVDSFNPAHTPLPMLGNKTPFDYVTDKMGQPPDFWARYIGGPTPVITPAEIAYFQTRNAQLGSDCRLCFVYNGPGGPKRVQGDYDSGQDDARAAAQAARNAGIPIHKNIMLYVDIESWSPSKDWLRGWFWGMMSTGYRAGVYLGPDVLQFIKSVRDALQEFFDASLSGRYTPLYFWVTDPRKGAVLPEVKPYEDEFEVGPFTYASSFAKDIDERLAIWQYGINCQWHGERFVTAGANQGIVDVNVCDERAFRSMLKP